VAVAIGLGGALWWYARWRRTQPGPVSRKHAPDRRGSARRH